MRNVLLFGTLKSPLISDIVYKTSGKMSSVIFAQVVRGRERARYHICQGLSTPLLDFFVICLCQHGIKKYLQRASHPLPICGRLCLLNERTPRGGLKDGTLIAWICTHNFFLSVDVCLGLLDHWRALDRCAFLHFLRDCNSLCMGRCL